jgi:hypothetical protein
MHFLLHGMRENFITQWIDKCMQVARRIRLLTLPAAAAFMTLRAQRGTTSPKFVDIAFAMRNLRMLAYRRAQEKFSRK